MTDRRPVISWRDAIGGATVRAGTSWAAFYDGSAALLRLRGADELVDFCEAYLSVRDINGARRQWAPSGREVVIVNNCGLYCLHTPGGDVPFLFLPGYILTDLCAWINHCGNRAEAQTTYRLFRHRESVMLAVGRMRIALKRPLELLEPLYCALAGTLDASVRVAGAVTELAIVDDPREGFKFKFTTAKCEFECYAMSRTTVAQLVLELDELLHDGTGRLEEVRSDG